MRNAESALEVDIRAGLTVCKARSGVTRRPRLVTCKNLHLASYSDPLIERPRHLFFSLRLLHERTAPSSLCLVTHNIANEVKRDFRVRSNQDSRSSIDGSRIFRFASMFTFVFVPSSTDEGIGSGDEHTPHRAVADANQQNRPVARSRNRNLLVDYEIALRI